MKEDSMSIEPIKEDTAKVEASQSCTNMQIETYFQPRQKDTLFWCLYLLHYGTKAYHDIGHNYGVKEMEEKHKISQYVKEHMSKIKTTNYKVTNILLQEIMSELVTIQPTTSINVMLAMIVYYNINIIIVEETGKCMLTFWSDKDRIPSIDRVTDNEDASTYVLYKDAYGKYKAQLEPISPSTILQMQEQLVTLDSYQRALKPMAHYTVPNLIEIAKKLSCYDETKKYKKAELYNEIARLCVWK